MAQRLADHVRETLSEAAMLSRLPIQDKLSFYHAGEMGRRGTQINADFLFQPVGICTDLCPKK